MLQNLINDANEYIYIYRETIISDEGIALKTVINKVIPRTIPNL